MVKVKREIILIIFILINLIKKFDFYHYNHISFLYRWQWCYDNCKGIAMDNTTTLTAKLDSLNTQLSRAVAEGHKEHIIQQIDSIYETIDAVKNGIAVSTWMPMFPGFYGTFYDDEHYIDWNYELEYFEGEDFRYNDDRIFENVTYDDVDFDYDRYKTDIVASFSDSLVQYLSEHKIVSYIGSLEIVSPRYYNFSNDSVNCDIYLNEENIVNIHNYIYASKEEFSQFVKDNYTSCDGFISSYSNSFEDWERYTDGFKFNNDGDYSHYLGKVLEFITKSLLEEDGEDEMMFYYNVSEHVYGSEYISINEDKYNSNREQ
jgi:hypothetical protein